MTVLVLQFVCFLVSLAAACAGVWILHDSKYQFGTYSNGAPFAFGEFFVSVVLFVLGFVIGA